MYLPIDSNLPKTSYERLLELRKVETTEEIQQQRINKEKEDLALKHGCQYVINYKEESVPEKVMEITSGQGVPVVYDCLLYTSDAADE